MKTIWLKLKKIKPELILFWLFVISIPWQKRHIFNLDQAQIDGHFLEWSAVSLYLSDILIGLCFLAWFIRGLSSLIRKVEKKGEIIEKGKFTLLYFLLGAFLLVGITSLAVNYSFDNYNVFRLIKLAEFILLFLFIVKYINTFKLKLFTISVFIATAFFQSIVAIIQYLKQGSIGLTAFGETVLSPEMVNVAKIILDGNKVLRAYGTFPHANALSGFLVLALIFVFSLVLLKIKDLGLFREKGEKHQWRSVKFFSVNSENFWLCIISIIICILFWALTVTYSRTAWFGLLFAASVLVILFSRRVYLALKSINKKRINYRNFLPIILVILFIAVIFAVYYPAISTRAVLADQAGDMAVTNRTFYNEKAIEMIEKNLIFGVGVGNFVLRIDEYVNFDIQWWQYQPVHSMYLLIGSEIGLLGFLVFGLLGIWVLRKAYLNYRRGDMEDRILIIGLFGALIAIFVISFFDHYWWDIQQDTICLWMVLGLLCSKNLKT